MYAGSIFKLTNLMSIENFEAMKEVLLNYKQKSEAVVESNIQLLQATISSIKNRNT